MIVGVLGDLVLYQWYKVQTAWTGQFIRNRHAKTRTATPRNLPSVNVQALYDYLESFLKKLSQKKKDRFCGYCFCIQECFLFCLLLAMVFQCIAVRHTTVALR